MSGSLKGRRSEEMTQSNTSSPQELEVPSYLLSSRGVMIIKVPQNEEISGVGKNGGREGIGINSNNF